MCHPQVPDGEWADAPTEEVSIPLEGGESMPGMVARPAGTPSAAVLVIPDIFGRSPFYENLSRRIAASGRLALLVEYFFRVGPIAEPTFELAIERRGRLDENGTLRDLAGALDWLRARNDVSGSRLGTIGFCMAGTFALNLSARHDDLAGVCFYGFPAGAAAPGDFSGPAPLDEVDQIKGPVIGFWGDQDQGVGMDNVHRYVAAMAEQQVEFSHTVYPGVGHGFLSASQFDPGHDAYDASVDAWSKTLSFYDLHLGG
jgi:carboxymethylenebutenolidase